LSRVLNIQHSTSNFEQLNVSVNGLTQLSSFMWELHLAAISVPKSGTFRGKMPLPQSQNHDFWIKPEN